MAARRAGGLVVVGASLAGLRAVEAARKGGYRGAITLLGAERWAPYDRPPLSKAYLAGHAPATPPTFDASNRLQELGVESVFGVPARALDTRRRAVVTDEDEYGFDALIVATGAEPRNLDVSEGLDGIHLLRSFDDAVAVRAALDASRPRVVVVGGGFIGAEVASAARKRGLEATIVESAATPLVRALGEPMAAACARLHSQAGTELRCGVDVVGFVGNDRVAGVRLSNGESIPCELVVVGVGAVPATGWLAGSDLDVANGVVCEEHLQSSVPGIFAAGDVARWLNPTFDEVMRLENWTAAAEQGSLAAHNAVGSGPMISYSTVPYFWSDWYDARLQFTGLSHGTEVEVVDGTVEESRFVALYRRGDRLVGALTVNRPTEIMKYRALITRNCTWADAADFAQYRRLRTSA